MNKSSIPLRGRALKYIDDAISLLSIIKKKIDKSPQELGSMFNMAYMYVDKARQESEQRVYATNKKKRVEALAKMILAMNFPTQDAYTNYLNEHPAADRKNHNVEKPKRKENKPKEDKKEEKKEKPKSDKKDKKVEKKNGPMFG